MSYVARPDDELDQGDLIRRVVVCRKVPLYLSERPELVVSHVCVISHGCDIDKPRFDTVLVARITRLSAIADRGMTGNIRSNRVYEAFYLPATGALHEEAYVDWRTIQAIDKQALISARATERYMCSLDEQTLAAASEGLWRFLFRQQARR